MIKQVGSATKDYQYGRSFTFNNIMFRGIEHYLSMSNVRWVAQTDNLL
jgi:hypothetical protein